MGNSDEMTTPLIDEKTSKEETQTYNDVHMSQSNSEADLNDSLSKQRKISPLEIQTYSVSPSNTYLHMKSLASPTGEELTEGLLSRDVSQQIWIAFFGFFHSDGLINKFQVLKYKCFPLKALYIDLPRIFIPLQDGQFWSPHPT